MVLPYIMDKYFCGHCNYTTLKLSHYTRHCETKTHLNKVNKVEKVIVTKQYVCKYCSKEYLKANSVWYHEKKCKINKEEIIKQAKIIVESIVDTKMNTIIQSNEENMNMIIQSNQETTKILKEEIETLNQKIENVKPNVFNLHFFLNEQCKGAMSIDTFLSQLHIQFNLSNSLEQDAIKAMVQTLETMNIYQRPIHCLDLKRNKLCIKDKDEWSTDPKIFDKVPKYVEKMYGKEINEWEKRNYGFLNDDEKLSVFIQHTHKFGQVMNSLKILRPVLKVTTIPKQETLKKE